MTTLADLITALERAYPPELAESWDAIGLVCGDPDQPVTRAHACVDPVESTVDEAIAGGAQLIVAHHPLLLRGVHGVPANTPKGGIVHRLIRSGVALYCAHTNADAADPGVSDALAAALGLTVTGPLVPGTGTGRIGTLPATEPLRAFTDRVASALPFVASGVRAAGDPDRPIRTVAVCGGAGDGFLDDAVRPVSTRTSPLISGTIRPGNTWPGRCAALVDVAHWASEWPWCEQAAGILRGATGGTVDVFVSTRRTDPGPSTRPAGTRAS